MITITGWQWEYIDINMTIPRLKALQTYWDESPPVHIALNRLNLALLKQDSTKSKRAESKGNLNDFIKDFLSQGGNIAGAENVNE